MGFFARLKFLIGLLVVIGLVAGLFLVLNYSISNIRSQKASLENDAFGVSTEYPGALRRQFVQVGDKVKEGDRLFEISSPDLVEALRNDRVERDTQLFEVTDDDNMILLANASGTVQQINFADGAYVEANAEIATVSTDNARYVIARYLLNAPDYARISRDNPVQVTLPDNTKYNADVFDIALEQDGQLVYTVVRARLPKEAQILPTFTSGTPVSTSWQLKDNPWQDTLSRFVRSLIEPQSQGE